MKLNVTILEDEATHAAQLKQLLTRIFQKKNMTKTNFFLLTLN